MTPRILFAAVLLAPALALGAPRGTVVLNNGTILEDVEYEVSGKRVKVTLKYGARTYRMDEVRRLIPAGGAKTEEGGGATSEGGGLEGGNWETRFQMTPLEGWSVVEPASPLVRARMVHDEHDAFVEVSVRPADSEWKIGSGGGRNARVPREVSDSIAKDLAAQYAAQPRPRIGPMPYKFSQAYVLGPFAAAPYTAAKGQFRMVTEVRFRRFGMEYAVTFSVKKEDEGAVSHQMPAALAAFSFLPALSEDAEHYADFEHGVSLRRPNEEWTVESNPFSSDRPVLLTTKDKRGQVTVQVEPGRPEGVVGEMFTRRKKASRHFVKKKQESAKHRGSQVVAFEFEDFQQGGRKKLHFQGFAAYVRGKTVVVTGMAPLSDEDAKKIDREVRTILDGVRLYDDAQVRRQLGSERDALSALSRGHAASLKRRNSEAVQAFDEAISAMPNFALAYYMRGQANKALGDIKAYAADVEKAGQLAPDAGYGDELGDLARTEAVSATNRKDWGRAMELWRRVYSSSKKPADLKQLTNAGGAHWNAKKAKPGLRDTVKSIEKTLKPVRKVKEVHVLLHRIYREACTTFTKAKDWSNAKRMASSMKKLGKAVKEKRYVTDATGLEANIKRARGR